MPIFTNIYEVITPNELAIALFTNGLNFTFDTSGRGTTGNWVLNPERLDELDKVIIYLRRVNDNVNHIFIGTYAGFFRSEQPRRYKIRFANLQEVGKTTKNWLEFAEAGQNPVCYIRR